MENKATQATGTESIPDADALRHGREALWVSYDMVVRWGWWNTYNLVVGRDRAEDLPTRRTGCGVGLLQPCRNAGLAKRVLAVARDSDGIFHWIFADCTILVFDRLQTSSQQVLLSGKSHLRELRGQEDE
jgi:hypothetical protein